MQKHLQLFPRPTGREMGAVRQYLSTEFIGGIALFAAVVIALALANSPWQSAYHRFTEYQIGFGAYRLDVRNWAADGLLAIFFAVAGLELRREITHGDLRNPRQVALPVIAALCGMAVPALIYSFITRSDAIALHAWAIPTATDLAFCLTILGITGSKIPSPLRAFLLTLAITDDLGAIVLIAIFYAGSINWLYLLLSLLVLLVYGLLQRRGFSSWWLAVPLALTAWALMHHSGVHATVAGILIGLLTNPNRDRPHSGPAERYEKVLGPMSALISVPLFAFVTIGLTFTSGTVANALHDKIAYAIVIARLFGKVAGIVGGAWVISKVTRAELNPDLSWWDVTAIGVLAGIGFAVSLLVAVVSLGVMPTRFVSAQTGILASGIISAVLAIAMLQWRNRHHIKRLKSAH